MNFLEETREAINKSGHDYSDIMHITTRSFRYDYFRYECNWRQFSGLADKEYNPKSSAPKVDIDLAIIFSDGSKLLRDHDEEGERWYVSEALIVEGYPLKLFSQEINE